MNSSSSSSTSSSYSNCKASRKINTHSVAFHDPALEYAKHHLKTANCRGDRKLKPAISKEFTEIGVRSRETNKRIDVANLSYLHDQCPTSATAYQDPEVHERELQKFLARNYPNDRVSDSVKLTPSMIDKMERDFDKEDDVLFSTDHLSSDFYDFTTSEGSALFSREYSTESEKRTTPSEKCRRKGRCCNKARKSNTKSPKNPIRSKKSSGYSLQDTFLAQHYFLQDPEVNYFFAKEEIPQNKDDIDNNNNNNIVTVHNVLCYDGRRESKIKRTAEKTRRTPVPKWSPLPPVSIPTSAENFSYPPEICGEYFYNWVDKLPVRKLAKSDRNNNSNFETQVPQVYYETENESDESEKSKCAKYRTSRDHYGIPDFDIGSIYADSSMDRCPNIHDMEEIPGLDSGHIAAAFSRQDPCNDKNKRGKKREPIFYKLLTDQPPRPSTERDFIYENSVRVVRTIAAKKDPFFMDDEHGTRHNLIRSGLAPVHLSGGRVGKVPEYLEERRRALGLPPCDLSVYRVKKRCPKCGHDHAYCSHRRMEEEKLRDILREQKRNRFHNPGAVPFPNNYC